MKINHRGNQRMKRITMKINHHRRNEDVRKEAKINRKKQEILKINHQRRNQDVRKEAEINRKKQEILKTILKN